jgi:parallel beta-helix repeat protein
MQKMTTRGWFGWVAAAWLGLGWLQPPCAAAEMQGHRFGEWPAINAMMHDETQKNLNAEDCDFLVEVWFKPLPKVEAKRDSVNTLVSKKLGGLLAGYELNYSANGELHFAVCDEARELDSDLTLSAACDIRDNQWTYAAAARSGDSLRLYKDGALVKATQGNKLGVIRNQDLFNVGYGSLGSQAHCEIREVRFWRVRKGERVDFDPVVASHGGTPATLSKDLTAKADYSRWTFTPEGETLADLGNNGNRLMYVPLGYRTQDMIAIKPFPSAPVGKTYYVDPAHPAAADAPDGGSKDRPFASIHRGLKALRPGDVLHICKGRYFLKTALLLPRGENGKPVTIEGEDGTVLYGTEPVTGWEKIAEDTWVVKGWKGAYQAPIDVKEWDARSHPGNVLFAGDDIMDYANTRADLTPGSWNVDPVEGRGPKTFTLRLPPGMEPATSKIEITVCGGLINATAFNHVRNLHLTRAGGGMGLGGRGHLIENNRLDWMSGGAFGVIGQDITIRNNVIEWTGGIGGASARLRFENNIMRYNAWTILDAGWAGGAIKFIPSCIDHVVRGNEFAYNRTATVWYDAGNQGNLIENNVMHDNQGAGFFDEFNFDNTIRGNLVYNNANFGIYLGNSCGDQIVRNIVFNNTQAAIGFRGASHDHHRQTNAAKAKAQADWMTAKWDVRRYQGMLTYDRERPYRERLLKYGTEYADREVCRHNTIAENAFFDNGTGGWASQAGNRLPYGRPGITVDPDAESTFRSNYYGSGVAFTGSDTNLIARAASDLAEWQRVSGQDQGSQWINPWIKTNMPAWFQKKMPFAQGHFRPYQTVVDLTGGEVRKFSPSRLLLRGRLVESKYLKVVDFEESGVRGVYFDLEGKRCLALWSRSGMGMTDWILPAGQKDVVVENKWLNRKTMSTADGRLSLLVADDQTVLIGLTGDVQEDKSLSLRIPEYNEPAKPISGTVRLDNQGTTEQRYELRLNAGAGFVSSVTDIRETVPAGGSKEIALTLTRQAGIGKGAYQVGLDGTVGGRAVKKTKGFVLGTRNIAPFTYIHVDGDLSDWDRNSIPSEVADTKEQVIEGANAWQGPDDCSAKMRVAWADNYMMTIGLDVTDDKLVINQSTNQLTASDSVQVFLDVRTPWKLFINDYGVGAFQLLIVPGNADHPDATVEFIGPMIAHQKSVVTRKTAKGYTAEVRLRFRNMDEPGWVAGREFRVGALVNDCDDAAAGRKSVVGLWRTAADAVTNCATLTRFELK